jgi:hypothetical protein
MYSPEVRSYRLDPTAFEPMVKRRIRRRLAWALPWFVVVVTPMLVLLAHVQDGVLETLPFTVPVILVSLGFGAVRALKWQRKNGKQSWDSYQLSLSENAMRRFIGQLPAVEIVRPEVTRIIDAPGDGLTVTTADRQRFIFIPEQLIGYPSVRAELSSWRSFERQRLLRVRAAQMGWTLLVLSLWLASGVASELWVAMAAGVALWVAGAISIRETLKLGFVDNQYKARVVGVLCFFMLAPLGRLTLQLVFGMKVPGIEMPWPK